VTRTRSGRKLLLKNETSKAAGGRNRGSRRSRRRRSQSESKPAR